VAVGDTVTVSGKLLNIVVPAPEYVFELNNTDGIADEHACQSLPVLYRTP